MWLDLYLTRLIRLGGLVIAMHAEFFIKGDRSASFGAATVMMSASFLLDAYIKRVRGGNGESDGS